MLCPALTISDVEDMTIKEISDRVTFFNEIKKEKEKIMMREFFTILSSCIATGTNYGTTGKNKSVREFIKSINKLFSKKTEEG